MYKLIKTAIFIIIPFFGFSQGMNLKLLEFNPNGQGFIGYTESDGRQAYHNLDSLIASYGYLLLEQDGSTLNEVQIYSLSDYIVNGDTLGVVLEMSQNGGITIFKEGNFFDVSRNGNMLIFTGIDPDSIETQMDYINSGTLDDNNLILTGVGSAGTTIPIPPNWDKDAADDFSGDYNDLSNLPIFGDSIGIQILSDPPVLGDPTVRKTITASLYMGQTVLNSESFGTVDRNDIPYQGSLDDTNLTINVTNNQDFNIPIPSSWDKDSSDDFSGDYNDLSNLPSLFDGTWGSLSGKPLIFPTNWANVADKPTLFDGDYNSLSNLPTLFSGDYNDLSNLPDLFDGTWESLSGKPTIFPTNWANVADKPTLFDGDYNSLSNLPTLFSGDYNDLSNKPIFGDNIGIQVFSEPPVLGDPTVRKTITSSLYMGQTVLNSESFGTVDRNDIPYEGSLNDTNLTIKVTNNQDFTIPIPSNWDKDSSDDFDGNYNSLSNLPTLFDGNYNSLSNLPTLFDGTWGSLSGKPTIFPTNWANVADKPTLFDGDYNSLSNLPILFSGDYNDLTNKPTIPTDTNLSTNDITFSQNRFHTLNSELNFLGGTGSKFLVWTPNIDLFGTAGGSLQLSTATSSPLIFKPKTSTGGTGMTIINQDGTTGEGQWGFYNYNNLTNLPSLFDGAWGSLSGVPSGFADGVDDTGGLAEGTGYDVNGSDQFEYDFNELGTMNHFSIANDDQFILKDISTGATNKFTWSSINTAIAPSWSNLQNVPSGFADGVDDTGGLAEGTGYDVNGSNQFEYDFNELGTMNSFSIANDDQFILKDISTGATNKFTWSSFNTAISPSWNNLSGIPAGFADGVDNTGADGNDFINSSTLTNTTLNLNGSGSAGTSINLLPITDFSSATFITGAGQSSNTYTATSPTFIQTAADVFVLDDNRPGRAFIIQVHSGSAQVVTTSGSVVVDGTAFTSGGYAQPQTTTHAYIRNDANTQWYVLKF